MLTYVCPVCKTKASLELVIYVAVDDKEARHLIDYLVKTYQPTLGADTLRYLRLHTPAKQRLSWARVRKVLGDVVEAMRSRKVNRAGREWPVAVEDWQAAYRAIFDAQDKGTLVLPLKDNAYLYAVLVRRVDKSEAIAEAKAEQDRRSGPRADLSGHSLGVATSVSAALDGAMATMPAAVACHPAVDAAGHPVADNNQTSGGQQAAAPAPVTSRAVREAREAIARHRSRRERLLQQADGTANQEGQGDADA